MEYLWTWTMEWLFAYCFQVELEFRSTGFCGGRKTGDPRKKYSEQRTHRTTKPRIMQDLGHAGEKQALSLLHHHCSSTKSSQQ